MPKLPGIDHRDAVRASATAGFTVAREGKHTVMTDGTRITTIPRHNPVNAETMAGVVHDAGLTLEQFRKLLSPTATTEVLPMRSAQNRGRRWSGHHHAKATCGAPHESLGHLRNDAPGEVTTKRLEGATASSSAR